MISCSGEAHPPLLILHGGAGAQDPKYRDVAAATEALKEIAAIIIKKVHALSGLEIATLALIELENNPLFNAGLGSALQADGQARMSAALMDGSRQNFSGVIGAERIRNPSRIAKELQDFDSRNLAPPGVELKAREMGIKVESVLTQKRMERWLSRPSSDHDTVGVVYVDQDSRLYAGTSTGGRGFEYPGRVSDSATVAGNYASEFLAVSATGCGEDIIDDSLASRLETRVRDGIPLNAAAERCLAEAKEQNHSYGWIAAGKNGSWNYSYTTEAMTYVGMNESGIVFSS